MVAWRQEATLHTGAAALPVLDGSEFGFDRGWAPQGAGTLVVDLAAWRALGISSRERRRMQLTLSLYPYGVIAGGTMGQTYFGGSTLGASVWPIVEPAWLQSSPTSGYAPALAVERTWIVYLSGVKTDEVSSTATISVSTIELALTETRNAGGEWMPARTRNGQYILADVFAQLTRYLGVPLTIEWGASMVPADAVTPWRNGESAWEYLNAIRVAARRSFVLVPSTGTIRFLPLVPVDVGSAIPQPWLARGAELGGVGRVDGEDYADAIIVEWRHTDSKGEEVVTTEVAYATGVTDWRAATQLRHIELRGPRVAGIAQDIVTSLARLRSVASARTPVTQYTLSDLLTSNWLTVQYRLDTPWEATISTITSED